MFIIHFFLGLAMAGALILVALIAFQLAWMLLVSVGMAIYVAASKIFGFKI